MKRVPHWLWLVIFAALLRLPTLGNEQLWFDETFTAWTIAPTSDLWAAVKGDVHPPGWPLMQAVMVRLFGDGDTAFRLLSAFFGIATVLLMWRVALALGFYRKTAFTAGLLAALLPAAIYFSQDGRQYSALGFFVLLAVWAALRSNYVLLGAAGVGAAYMQNVGVLYFGALLLAVAAREIVRRRFINLPFTVLSGALFGTLWLPWAFIVAYQVARPAEGYWVPPLSLGGVIFPFLLNSAGWRMQPALQLPVYGIIIGLTMIALINCRHWLYKAEAWPLWGALVGGPLLLIVYCLFVTNVYVWRAIYPSGLALCLIWAYTLNHLSDENRAYARPLVAAALLTGVMSHFRPAHSRPEPSRLLDVARNGWEDGDTLYYLNATDAIAFGWYARDLPYTIRPVVGSLLAVTQECKRAFRLREWPLEQTGAERAWMIVSSQPYTPQHEIDEQLRLLATYPHELVFDANNGEGDRLYLLRLRFND